MFIRSKCDRKSQLSGRLTEPLNPRGLSQSLRVWHCYRQGRRTSIQRRLSKESLILIKLEPKLYIYVTSFQ